MNAVSIGHKIVFAGRENSTEESKIKEKSGGKGLVLGEVNRLGTQSFYAEQS